ncbi:hypothetical protein TNIN_434501 [Trichonephila inaurata madagascariensis]|uniref:Uncharacterized protein n=1 Tax=Trichonephila inaurata madagascariensis TaxID=2747483 RepID=A0A8X6ICB2_9ARAC|nr:hypothetical protein TNIN_434501 [Trichonephila inaurata madagascariensis]
MLQHTASQKRAEIHRELRRLQPDAKKAGTVRQEDGSIHRLPRNRLGLRTIGGNWSVIENVTAMGRSLRTGVE